MKQLTLRILFVFLTLSSVLYGQSTVYGTVFNKENNKPISEVYVYISDLSVGTITDGVGRYELTDITPGSHELVISNMGFTTIISTIELEDGLNLSLDFYLEESLYDLPDIMIESISLTGGYSGIEDIHGSAHFISRKDLSKFNVSDINKVLKSIPGIQIQEEEGFGLRPNIGIRGTSTERSAKITLMEDGVLIAPAPYSAPSAYYFPTVGRMDGLEILKGSSQIKHGPYTTGGALNMISKQIPVQKEGILDLSAGSYYNRKLESSFGMRKDNLGFLVQGFHYGSSGFKEFESKGNTGFRKTDIMAKFGINSGNSAKVYQSLEFKFGYTNELSNETYLGLSDQDFEENPLMRYSASQNDKMDSHHQLYNFSYTVEFSPRVQMNTTAYYNFFHRNWYKLDKVTLEGGDKKSISAILNDVEANLNAYDLLRGKISSTGALYLKANNRDYKSAGIQSILHFYLHPNDSNQKLNLGLRYHYDEMDRFQWNDVYTIERDELLLSDSGVPGTESNRIHTANAIAAFARLDLKIGKMHVNPGVRLETMELSKDDYGKEDPLRMGLNLVQKKNKETVVIPGISFSFQPDNKFNLFGGIHRGFSPPSTNEGSASELSINYEIGTKLDVSGIKGQLVGFFTDYSNLLGSDVSASGGVGNDMLFNGGEVDVKGVEAQLSYTVNGLFKTGFQLPIALNYSYTDARFKSSFESELDLWGTVEDGDQLPYLPKHQLSIQFGLENRRFELHGRINYHSRTLTRAGTMDMNEKYIMDPGFNLDIGFSIPIKRNIWLYADITNFTNNISRVARHPAGLRPSSPQMIMMGVRTIFK